MVWSIIRRAVPAFILLFSIASVQGQQHLSVHIDTQSGHAIERGASGYNVRIADKVWSYTHPDFQKAVDTLRPGWLRYFSGTMGDAFNSATGLYDYDYAWMMDHQQQYLTGYQFTKMKGPHRVYDLYQVLGSVGGKLVITVNAFTETPDIAAEMVRFCRNHHIEVEGYQFCNEPYFYVPHRNRYWWNDGYDYARKMKPYADSIRGEDPSAKLALNCTWDGIWGFMKEIQQYQEEQGRYWDIFSKHSYAPHIGGSESFQSAYRRANSRLIEVTSPSAMKQIEAYSWEGAPLLITEFGVWNRAISGIYSGIYVAEYTLRQLEHPNAWLIGSHEISGNARPARGRKAELVEAYQQGVNLNTDTLRTGIRLSNEGKAMRLIHQISSQSDYTWDVNLEGNPLVPGLNNQEVSGVYARAFRGLGLYDYLVLTNRSDQTLPLELDLDGRKPSGPFMAQWISSSNPLDRSFQIQTDTLEAQNLQLSPYSVLTLSWPNQRRTAPPPTRIYQALITGKARVSLRWWKGEPGQSYLVRYGTNPHHLDKILVIHDHRQNFVELKDLTVGETYTFDVITQDPNGFSSPPSNPINKSLIAPKRPHIFKSATRNQSATLWWHSVPDANGYWVYQRNLSNGQIQRFDAKAAFGYRVENLAYDQTYEFFVSAYHGGAEGPTSASVKLTPHEKLPIPARNISAYETAEGGILLTWQVQDSLHPEVNYQILRGTTLHQWDTIAEKIQGNEYLDTQVNPHTQPYFYTVLTHGQAGMAPFHPNIATVITRDQEMQIQVSAIEEKATYFAIYVQFNNVPLDGDCYGGVAVSDVSYLTVEEQHFLTQSLPSGTQQGRFEVRVPKEELTPGHRYSLKGFINTNGKSVFSSAPHLKLSFGE